MRIHIVNVVKSSVHHSAPFRRFWRKLTKMTKGLVKCIKNKKINIVKLN